MEPIKNKRDPSKIPVMLAAIDNDDLDEVRDLLEARLIHPSKGLKKAVVDGKMEFVVLFMKNGAKPMKVMHVAQEMKDKSARHKFIYDYLVKCSQEVKTTPVKNDQGKKKASSTPSSDAKGGSSTKTRGKEKTPSSKASKESTPTSTPTKGDHTSAALRMAAFRASVSSIISSFEKSTTTRQIVLEHGWNESNMCVLSSMIRGLRFHWVLYSPTLLILSKDPFVAAPPTMKEPNERSSVEEWNLYAFYCVAKRGGGARLITDVFDKDVAEMFRSCKPSMTLRKIDKRDKLFKEVGRLFVQPRGADGLVADAVKNAEKKVVVVESDLKNVVKKEGTSSSSSSSSSTTDWSTMSDAEYRKTMKQLLNTFVKSADASVTLDPGLSSAQRSYVHQLCDKIGLQHRSDGKKGSRVLTVWKAAAKADAKKASFLIERDAVAPSSGRATTTTATTTSSSLPSLKSVSQPKLERDDSNRRVDVAIVQDNVPVVKAKPWTCKACETENDANLKECSLCMMERE